MSRRKKGRPKPDSKNPKWINKTIDTLERWKRNIAITAIGLILGPILYVSGAFQRIDYLWEKFVSNDKKESQSYRIPNTQHPELKNDVYVVDPNGPRRFSRTDSRKYKWGEYHLYSEGVQRIEIGDCPLVPCVNLDYTMSSIVHSPPTLDITIHGTWGRSSLPAWMPIGLGISLKKGCGFSAEIPNYDILFEIIDDDPNSAIAEIMILHNNNNLGRDFHIIESD